MCSGLQAAWSSRKASGQLPTSFLLLYLFLCMSLRFFHWCSFCRNHNSLTPPRLLSHSPGSDPGSGCTQDDDGAPPSGRRGPMGARGTALGSTPAATAEDMAAATAAAPLAAATAAAAAAMEAPACACAAAACCWRCAAPTTTNENQLSRPYVGAQVFNLPRQTTSGMDLYFAYGVLLCSCEVQSFVCPRACNYHVNTMLILCFDLPLIYSSSLLSCMFVPRCSFCFTLYA
jgi:hypothetical protein